MNPGFLKFLLKFSMLFAAADSFGQRPREDWVWRGVMNYAPRQVSMALHKDMYISWDPAICGLFQAWQAFDSTPEGGVNFASAPFNNTHGPQPTSRGLRVYFRMSVPEIAGMSTNPVKNTAYNAKVWTIDGEPADCKFNGYRFSAGMQKATLNYILSGKGKRVTVQETPDYADIGGMPGLTRVFVFQGFPGTTVVKLNLNLGNWQVTGSGALQNGLLVQSADGTTLVTGTWP